MVNEMSENTEQEQQEHKEILRIQELFGDRIPNKEQYPRCFEYYVKLYKYMKTFDVEPTNEIVDLT